MQLPSGSMATAEKSCFRCEMLIFRLNRKKQKKQVILQLQAESL